MKISLNFKRVFFIKQKVENGNF